MLKGNGRLRSVRGFLTHILENTLVTNNKLSTNVSCSILNLLQTCILMRDYCVFVLQHQFFKCLTSVIVKLTNLNTIVPAFLLVDKPELISMSKLFNLVYYLATHYPYSSEDDLKLSFRNCENNISRHRIFKNKPMCRRNVKI